MNITIQTHFRSLFPALNKPTVPKGDITTAVLLTRSRDDVKASENNARIFTVRLN